MCVCRGGRGVGRGRNGAERPTTHLDVDDPKGRQVDGLCQAVAHGVLELTLEVLQQGPVYAWQHMTQAARQHAPPLPTSRTQDTGRSSTRTATPHFTHT